MIEDSKPRQLLSAKQGKVNERLLRLQDVMDLTGCKRSKLYDLVQRGEFPKPIKIDSCIHWPETKVRQWIADRIAAAEAGA